MYNMFLELYVMHQVHHDRSKSECENIQHVTGSTFVYQAQNNKSTCAHVCLVQCFMYQHQNDRSRCVHV